MPPEDLVGDDGQERDETPNSPSEPVPGRREETACPFVMDEERSDLQVDVAVGDGWSDQADRRDRARQAITQAKALFGDYAGEAAALADGVPAVANGMAVGRAIIGDEWIFSTEPLRVSAEGHIVLDIDFDVEDPGEAEVSAAVLLLTEAYAEVAGEHAEDLEAVSNLGRHLTSFARAGPDLIREIVTAATGTFESAASVDCSLAAEISPAEDASVQVWATASRLLAMVGGDIESPAEHEFAQHSVQAGLISGTGAPGVGVAIEGLANAEVRAQGFYSKCQSSALWACVWAGCCRTDGSWRYGLRSDLKFVFPEFMDDQCPDAAERSIAQSLEFKLNELLVESAAAVACEDHSEVEGALRAVLLDWYHWMAQEWGFFADAEFVDPEENYVDPDELEEFEEDE